jgi:hypothetical protein
MSRNLTLAIVALATFAFAQVPIAHADRTATVQEICASGIPDYQPFDVGGAVKCGINWWQAFWGGTPIAPFKGLALVQPGSHPIDRTNPWSDWVVTSRREVLPPPLIACDRTHCGPDVPIPCSGPGSPCG